MKELVGPYRIQTLLGHGGMGIVYLGIHDHLGREVAVKALAPELTRHPEFRERFFSEARVQARLQHTNIVTIYDLIEDEGSFFIVMEHVAGPTLETLLQGARGRGWDVGRSLHLARQILAGLDYAHSKGVIHRDVKPSNVLVSEGDLVKLTDFGIALLIGDKRLTASRSAVGTPTYMSPEQILRPRAVDHRSDVYGAAVVLYEMLAGRPPFDADTEYEIKKLQIEETAPDLRCLKPEVPGAVAEAIAVALRKDPEERFPSAGAFLRALVSEPAVLPITAPAALPAPALPSPGSRGPAPLGGAWKLPASAAALVLLAGTITFLLWDSSPAPAGRTVATAASVANVPTPNPRQNSSAPQAAPSPEVEAAAEPPSASSPQPPSPLSSSRPQLDPVSPVSSTAADRTVRSPSASDVVAPRDPLHDFNEQMRLIHQETRALLEEGRAKAAQEKKRVEHGGRAQPLALPPTPRLNITSLEMPRKMSPGTQTVAVVHGTLHPPLENSAAVTLRLRILQGDDQVAVGPILKDLHVPANIDAWKITVPIAIPQQLAGEYFLHIDIMDPSRDLDGSYRANLIIR